MLTGIAAAADAREALPMLKNFDHFTIVVREPAPAIRFFELLGFGLDKQVVITGERFARYMGVAGIEADHITLALEGASPRVEVQLLHYRHPDPVPDSNIANLTKLGFNHICFAVDDLDAEVAKLTAAGIELRSDVLDFHSRKLAFLRGPEGITVELAQWETP
jgi:catechol 2,3-dioxygenase-like lactoylglutathione lyase family enzyme